MINCVNVKLGVLKNINNIDIVYLIVFSIMMLNNFDLVKRIKKVVFNNKIMI